MRKLRIFVISMLLAGGQALAANPAEVEYILLQVLAREGALYVQYSIGDDGKVVMLFGKNEPDWRVDQTVKALKSHPDIPGLIWTKTDSEYCAIR